jgi:type IV pilus assembly protein PilV
MRPHRARGFTLIEAMLALAVLSVGLLGAAAMLLGSLRSHAGALQRLSATHLLRDMADRIRANETGRAHYAADDGIDCLEPAGCGSAQLAAADRTHFRAAARALFRHDDFTANVEFAPATGPATPDRYTITLRWREARDGADDTDSVQLLVLAQPPVAG